MASTAGLAATTVQTNSAEPNNATSLSNRGGPRNRNRNRNRNGNQEENRASHQPQGRPTSETPQSRGGGRFRGRGGFRERGDFRMQELSLEDQGDGGKADSSKNHSPSPAGGSTSRSHLITDTTTLEGEALAIDNRPEGEKDEDADVCFICASPVVHSSVAPCNHRTCHICALRLRALYKTTACAHCRVSFTPDPVYQEGKTEFVQSEAKYVIFTDDRNRRYQDYPESDFTSTDDVLGIKYDQREIYDDTVLLLRYNCPDPTCDIACWGWPDLHRHVKKFHHKIMCDLCTRNKKVFTHEHDLFTVQELRKHERIGDDDPGAVDQSGFKGHPECGFCRTRFYGDDELYTHCRDKHERCHVCDRRLQGREHQYYVDYGALELHFRNDHFLCLDQECIDKKFVVFESEMDLKAHQLEAHPNDLSKDARRDARRVDMSSFDYRAPHQELRRGRRDREGRGGGGGRGRDPNTEALPQSTAQPLRRDELAYQRQMAIQSAQSISTRNFGGQLTPSDGSSSRPYGSNRGGSSSMTVTRPRPNLNANDETPPVNSAPTAIIPETSTPQEQARLLHHTAVMERASGLLQNDPTKTASFRDGVSAFRTSKITAAQLLDTFFSIFSVPAAELGKLIKELADIYENEAKRNDLLKAWNDWRAINEDYPSLPGPSGVLPGSSAAVTGSGGHRVLKLKSSTAQSSRSAVSKQRSWGNAAATNANPFPPMHSASSSRTTGGRTATPWVAPSGPSSRSTGGLSSTPLSSAPSEVAFPALPAAAKPNTTIFGLTKGSVQWNGGRNGASMGSPWGAGAGGKASEGADEKANNTETNGTSKGKGKKQTLYRFG